MFANLTGIYSAACRFLGGREESGEMTLTESPLTKPLNEDDFWFDEPALFDWDAEKIFEPRTNLIAGYKIFGEN